MTITKIDAAVAKLRERAPTASWIGMSGDDARAVMAELAAKDARIAELEAALVMFDDLIRHQYSGSREAMSDID